MCDKQATHVMAELKLVGISLMTFERPSKQDLFVSTISRLTIVDKSAIELVFVRNGADEMPQLPPGALLLDDASNLRSSAGRVSMSWVLQRNRSGNRSRREGGDVGDRRFEGLSSVIVRFRIVIGSEREALRIGQVLADPDLLPAALKSKGLVCIFVCAWRHARIVCKRCL
jgi:hypothetical protein